MQSLKKISSPASIWTMFRDQMKKRFVLFRSPGLSGGFVNAHYQSNISNCVYALLAAPQSLDCTAVDGGAAKYFLATTAANCFGVVVHKITVIYAKNHK